MHPLIDEKMIERIRTTGYALDDRPAIRNQDEDAMASCRSLSKEFGLLNIEQAKILSVGRLILFCFPCYPIYKHAFPEKNTIFYPRAIGEIMGTLKWNGEIDYYARCYRLHQNLARVPMDPSSTNKVFRKIRRYSINRISVPACWFKPDGLAYMLDHVKTDCMVYICTGYYFQALSNMPKNKPVTIRMLPEFIDDIQQRS